MMQRQLKSFPSFHLLILLLGISPLYNGCSKSVGRLAPETLVEIKGTVSLDGKPLTGTTLNFIPDNGTSGTGGYAVTDATGQFQAMHYSSNAGLEPGTYKVLFSKIAKEDGTPIPDGQTAADVGAIEHLPPHLSTFHPDSHQYYLSVLSAPQTIDYELSTKPGRRKM